jgi:hypothetical protein
MSAYTILEEKRLAKLSVSIPRKKWCDNIKIDLKKILFTYDDRT